MEEKLLNLGFTERLIQESARHEGLFRGRVVAQYRDLYKVVTENSELVAEISGKMRHVSGEMSADPAVGEFELADRAAARHGPAILHQVRPRKSALVRRAAGTAHEIQVVAANIDTVFICMSLNRDFNLRRLERYLAVAWDSGSTPVVVLTKADLCDEVDSRLAEMSDVTTGVDVIVTSSMTGDGYEAIPEYVRTGQTVAFIGSSGVGKSTLINRLLGEDVIETGDVRKGDKGKHVTTRRDLIVVPTGGAVIDTPGMRELGVDTVDLARTFSDIDELSGGCRFRDCRHETEPGCRVRKAIAEGELSEERLASYRKLKKEAKYDGLSHRQIDKEKVSEMYSDFDGARNARAYVKSKKRER